WWVDASARVVPGAYDRHPARRRHRWLAVQLACAIGRRRTRPDRRWCARPVVVRGLLARQSGAPAKTYGYLRWEILAALINGTTLLLISVWIVFEAVVRFKHPEPVEGGLMLGVAALGFVVNGGAVWLLHGVRHGGLNVRGAYL